LEIATSFEYDWEYRPGRINVADPISRAPQNFCNILTCLEHHKYRTLISRDCLTSKHSVSHLPPREVHVTGEFKSTQSAKYNRSLLAITRSNQVTTANDANHSQPEPSVHTIQTGLCCPTVENQAEETVKYILGNFTDRMLAGYQHDPWFTSPAATALTTDSEGLCWTKDIILCIPSWDNLRNECISFAFRVSSRSPVRWTQRSP
jgi:hypothetical protein